MRNDDDAAWKTYCRFMELGSEPDWREPWEVETRPKRRARKRSVTLDRALKQASKAGIAVSGASLNADGSATLIFGEAPNGHDFNEWDTVQ